jgi:hypothetical protein
MTSNYSSMDYGFVSSPSQSPSLLYPNGPYFDSTSESSNPSSPDQMNQMTFNTIPMQYDMLQYDPSGNGMYPIGKIPVEYTGSSTLDDSDRRRRRTGSTTSSKESKEAVPNMHLVREAQYMSPIATLTSSSAGAPKTEPHNAPSGNEKRNTSKASSIN